MAFCSSIALLRAVTILEVNSALQTLGLPSTARADSVRTRYLDLAKRYHPDINNGDDSRMKAVNTAYDTIQAYHSQAPTKETSGPSGAPAPFERKRGTATRSTMADHSAWATKSEFDWAAAVNSVDERDLRNPACHPNTVNRMFSYDEDVSIFSMIRNGNTVSQVARTFGRSPRMIERRLDSAQFKLRAKKVLELERRAPWKYGNHMGDPAKRIVINTPSVRGRSEGEASERACDGDDDYWGDREVAHWKVDHLASAVGRSYANYFKFACRKGFR